MTDLPNNEHTQDDDIVHPTKPAHLDPSPLGTQAYWDETYLSELRSTSPRSNSHHVSETNNTNNQNDDDDEDDDYPTPTTSTDWFSEHCATPKLVQYLSTQESLSKPSTRILDLGCGNGALLCALRLQAGFTGPMMGIDYSASSIAVARRATRDIQPPIRFERWDIVREEAPASVVCPETGPGQWDVVLDKGTFDAVCLSADVGPHGSRVCEEYPARVAGLVKPDTGRLVVTSCCWTEDELRRWFDGVGLRPCGSIEYPAFVFGGRKGTCLACVVFCRPSTSSPSSSSSLSVGKT